MAQALIADSGEQVSGALAGWLAAKWELDLTKTADRAIFQYVVRGLDIALEAKDRARFLEEFHQMYDRLKAYRALRGRVEADETLDDWVDAFNLCAQYVVRERIRRWPR